MIESNLESIALSRLKLKIDVFMQFFVCRYDYSGYGASTGKVGHSLANATLYVLLYWMDHTHQHTHKHNSVLLNLKGSP